MAAAAAMSMTTTLLTSSLSFFHGSPLSIRAAQPRPLKSGLSITMSAANPSPLKFQPTKESIVDGAPKMISGQKQKAADLALRAFGQGQGGPRDSSKSKRTFSKSKGSFRRRLPPIQLGDRIDYRNMSLISRFISEQGKILSRRINRLTLKQQRQVTTAIKQARILSLLPFLNNEKQFERVESTPRTTGFRNRNR